MTWRPEQLEQAVRELLEGNLVAFATETVYGLGADAESHVGVEKIYAVKGRPAGHPIIVHISGLLAAQWWADIGAAGQALGKAFWPGPLTLIAPRRTTVPPFACGQESTIGLRAPAHPLAQALLQAFEAAGGRGVAAPSANLFGAVSPTSADHVRQDLGSELTVLDGGHCIHGLESTICDVSRARPVLLRPGSVTPQQINDVLSQAGLPLLDAHDRNESIAPRVSGSLAAHYAPRTPLELVDSAQLERTVTELAAQGVQLCVCSRTEPTVPIVQWQLAEPDPARFGARMYAMLRAFDHLQADRILLEAPPAHLVWDAVNDRLRRAAYGSGLR